MKNAGTPAIEDESESGSGGVSADGFGARLPRRGVAVVPPGFGPAAPVPPAFGAPEARERPRVEPAGVAPCELCPLTCGVVAAGGGVVLVVGAVSVVVGVGVVGVLVEGVGASLVGVELAGCSGAGVTLVVVASSAASERAGATSTSASATTVRSVGFLARKIIISCRAGS
jgi:hypothetical protein